MNKPFLLWDRKFWPLCLTQFLGALNDNFFKNSLIILITFESLHLSEWSAEKLIALSAGIFIFPFFLFSAFAGQIADKYEKSRLMFYIKTLECGIMLLALIGFLMQSLFVLLPALFLMGFQSALFSPLKYSYMPQQLAGMENRQTKTGKLVSANALLQGFTFLAILLGTVFGGLTAAVPGKGIIYAGLGVLVLSVAGLCCSLFILKAPPAEPALKLNCNPFSSTGKLIYNILPSRDIRWTIFILAWFWFYGATLLSILPGYGKNILGGTEHTVTFLLSLLSVGIGLGCMICKKFSREKIKIKLALTGALGFSVFLFDLFLHSLFLSPAPKDPVTVVNFIKNPENLRVILDLTLIAFSGGLFFVPLMTYLQKISPAKELSRIIAGGNILDAAFMVLASVGLIICFNLNLKEPEIFCILSLLNLIVCFALYKFSKNLSPKNPY